MHARTITDRLTHRIALAFLVVAMCLTVASASATPAPAPRAVSADHISTNQAIAARALSDPAELQGFLDALLSRQMVENHIPGVSVAVVQDGRLFFAKGHGYANLEQQTPLVADQTLIRVGSVAKLFTWTAVISWPSKASSISRPMSTPISPISRSQRPIRCQSRWRTC
jgi:CubicO group peptidase (beta-lactamase class C family)